MTGKVAWRIGEKRNGTGAWAGQTAVRNARSLEKQGKAHYVRNEGSPGSGPLRKQWAGGGEAPVWVGPIEGGWGAQAAVLLLLFPLGVWIRFRPRHIPPKYYWVNMTGTGNMVIVGRYLTKRTEATWLNSCMCRTAVLLLLFLLGVWIRFRPRHIPPKYYWVNMTGTGNMVIVGRYLTKRTEATWLNSCMCRTAVLLLLFLLGVWIRFRPRHIPPKYYWVNMTGTGNMVIVGRYLTKRTEATWLNSCMCRTAVLLLLFLLGVWIRFGVLHFAVRIPFLFCI